uniref:ORF-1 n=1 Tax=Snake paramyxovirus TaxID=659372 RepID=E7D7K0_9MONO|nr:ORF-1 [Snake paramyxovirus]ADT91318.1 ORF-1 [Snake paramyxovirus]
MSHSCQDGDRPEGEDAPTINVETGEIEGTETSVIQRVCGSVDQRVPRGHQRVGGRPFQQRWDQFYETAAYRRLCCEETGEFI